MSRIRTNAHPTILTSGKRRRDNENHILAYYRESHDGADSVRELLYATQLLRAEYDSPRIGGGIDPEICTLGMGASVDAERQEEGSFLNYLLGPDDDYENPFSDLTANQMQDVIVHAEAVALTWLAVFGDDT